ncbi:hypothetical protein [Dysgonomonas sp. Marseille-P4361]|uniref:DUF5018-related domain-containing protein n=1 Tax=Dysgonomonas sp. Marseille-P4361 TaxID=2161820 RepID=UPI000D55FC0B|nr:hypothetical protein [Dysgonomonas sp. Marseille-P4361]
MKKNSILSLILVIMVACFPSCLESGLDDLPTYSETEVKAINFEYRWAIPENVYDPWAGEKMQVKTLTTKANFADGVIECEITVPAASGTFTEEVRSKVSLDNLIAYVTISPGASIAPNGSSPMLGKAGDFSKADMSYKVTAADGKNKQDWKLVIKSFIK